MLIRTVHAKMRYKQIALTRRTLYPSHLHVCQAPNMPRETAELLPNADVVAVYFSAHWCPPCRQFAPALAQVYADMKAAGKKFEIVFVSSDQDESGFDA